MRAYETARRKEGERSSCKKKKKKKEKKEKRKKERGGREKIRGDNGNIKHLVRKKVEERRGGAANREFFFFLREATAPVCPEKRGDVRTCWLPDKRVSWNTNSSRN